ncbi:MAG: sulfatase family protein [Bacteroidota bacterium]
MKNYKLLFVLAIFCLSSAAAYAQGENESPNVVIILTDDMGYADVGAYGAPKIETPEIDDLASQGTKFTDFYVESLCSPTRAALMTGSYAHRTGNSGVYWPDSDEGLNPDEITIAEMLNNEGYNTGMVGKWHLGHRDLFLPTNQGFDYYFGLPFSNDMGPDARPAKGPYDPLPVMRNEEVVERGPDQSQLTKRYTEEAVQFIEDKKDEDDPFFLYLAHTMPHVPLYASEEFEGKSDFGLYGDVIEEIDWSTGQVMDALEEAGVKDNTLVVFLSDNGPWLQKGKDGGLATPLRNGKGTSWEGGHRVPAIMSLPGEIPENSTIKEMATVMDLFPTLAHLTGADTPEDRVIDGKNIWPLLTGESEETPHEVYFYYRLKKLQAVRIGDWKLHLEGKRRDYNNVNYDYSKDFVFEQDEELYNLAEDVGEQRNLAKDYPEIVEKLKNAVKEHKKEIKKNSRPEGSVE